MSSSRQSRGAMPRVGKNVVGAIADRSVDPTLHNDDAEFIARRVVEALREEERPATRGLLNAAEAAHLLGVGLEWVRAHRVALGAVKLGDGPKAHLRFPREGIDAYLAARRVGGSGSGEEQRAKKPRRPSSSTTAAPALRAAGEPVIDW